MRTILKSNWKNFPAAKSDFPDFYQTTGAKLWLYSMERSYSGFVKRKFGTTDINAISDTKIFEIQNRYYR
jgi:hypothetical protein